MADVAEGTYGTSQVNPATGEVEDTEHDWVGKIDPTTGKPIEKVEGVALPKTETALASPYEDLAQSRLEAPTPEFTGYVPPEETPEVERGETFMTPETTVAGQLEKIFKKGSPLMDLQETRARAEASALGMLSSSAGIGAGQRALYDKGLEIATPDAATAAEFKRAEQATLNQQQTIATEAQVSGALTQQKAEIAEQQKKLDDSFALSLRGLDTQTEANMVDQKGKWDAAFREMDANLARSLQSQEINANVEAAIMNQTTNMVNSYQESIQMLLGDESFRLATTDPGVRDKIFNDMFQTTVASLKFTASAAGVYDATFADYLSDLAEDNKWG